MGLPIEPLLAQLDGPDEEDSERAQETLARLALLRSAPAREALRRYVREGEWWQEALSVLVDGWPTDWWEDLGPDAVRHAPPDAGPTARIAELRDSPVEGDELREAAAGRLR